MAAVATANCTNDVASTARFILCSYSFSWKRSTRQKARSLCLSSYPRCFLHSLEAAVNACFFYLKFFSIFPDVLAENRQTCFYRGFWRPYWTQLDTLFTSSLEKVFHRSRSFVVAFFDSKSLDSVTGIFLFYARKAEARPILPYRIMLYFLGGTALERNFREFPMSLIVINGKWGNS